jgi:hypothetical protein
MDEINTISSFKTINEEIKSVLGELDEYITLHPYFDSATVDENNDTFIEMLDKLLDVRYKIEKLKKYSSK